MTALATSAWTPDGVHVPLAEAVAGASAITLVGAGGKTTLLHALGDALADAGKRVLLTTTTRMEVEEGLVTDVESGLDKLDQLTAGRACRDHRDAGRACRDHRVAVLAGTPTGDGKFGPLPDAVLDRLRGASDVVIVEGDGARRLPFKVPAAHEPVVPEWTDLLIVVAGLSAIGRPLAEVCCRAELAPGLLGSSPDILDAPTAARLLRAGYLTPAQAQGPRRLVILNQADDAARWASGRLIADALPRERVLLASTVTPPNPQEFP